MQMNKIYLSMHNLQIMFKSNYTMPFNYIMKSWIF